MIFAQIGHPQNAYITYFLYPQRIQKSKATVPGGLYLKALYLILQALSWPDLRKTRSNSNEVSPASGKNIFRYRSNESSVRFRLGEKIVQNWADSVFVEHSFRLCHIVLVFLCIFSNHSCKRNKLICINEAFAFVHKTHRPIASIILLFYEITPSLSHSLQKHQTVCCYTHTKILLSEPILTPFRAIGSHS